MAHSQCLSPHNMDPGPPMRMALALTHVGLCLASDRLSYCCGGTANETGLSCSAVSSSSNICRNLIFATVWFLDESLSICGTKLSIKFCAALFSTCGAVTVSRSLSFMTLLGLLLRCRRLLPLPDALGCWAGVGGGGAAMVCCSCASCSSCSSGWCPGSGPSKLPMVLEVKQL